MKLIRKKIRIFDIEENFTIFGQKDDLLKFEKILQNNGIKNDYYWNKRFRQISTAIYIHVTISGKNKKYYYDRETYESRFPLLFDVNVFL